MSESPKLSPRIIGQVKWFNNKAGYGFITVSDGVYSGKDIFAHYSTIGASDTQYRYLVQGEYVEFNLSISTKETHEYQATNISGIKNGLLMCETRRQSLKKELTVDTTPRRPMRQMVEKPLSPVDIDGFKVVAKKRIS